MILAKIYAINNLMCKAALILLAKFRKNTRLKTE